MADTVVVNKTVKQRTFVKYRVLIERVDVVPIVKKDYGLTGPNSKPEYGYLPEYDAVQFENTEALKMEIREEIDLRAVVKALLWEEK
jgi:hypothetical protein